MARSIWNGTISFGMVSVPIKLYSATESKTVRFHQVHLKDGARLEHRRFCAKEDEQVPYSEVVKGYEVEDGRYVVLEKDEVKAAAGQRGKVIEIEEFVEAEHIDPMFFEKTYYAGSRDDEDTYRLLHDALVASGKAGVGRFTFHDREYLVAIAPLDSVIALHTMRFHDEVVPGDELGVKDPPKQPTKKEVAMAEKLIGSLHERFDPSKYEDTHRKAVMTLIEQKAGGKKIEAPEPEEAEETDDLMAALEASLAGSES